MTTTARGRLVLITGAKEFEDQELIEDELALIERPAFIMNGGQRGADFTAGQATHMFKGFTEVRVPYLRIEEKQGGWIRNQKMLEIMQVFREVGYEVWVMAFYNDINNPTPGTSNMVKLAKKADFVIVYIDGMSRSRVDAPEQAKV